MRNDISVDDFSPVSELPGVGATKDQLARLNHRYQLVDRYATGKRVLEVACGVGMGLGHISRKAKQVVGGDLTDKLLRIARSSYDGLMPLLRLDAQRLPFADRSFDLVVMFEAIYYVPHPEWFVGEARRVLDAGGVLLVGTVNKDWAEFSPSAFSERYYSVPELNSLLQDHGFESVEFFGAFPTASRSLKRGLISSVRRLASGLHLMPGTLRGRALLKRVFYGSLSPLPTQLVPSVEEAVPTDVISGLETNTGHKIVYCVGHRRSSET
jgi:ubiquinone/menaquinone biosynthesis C-methylase UbiE